MRFYGFHFFHQGNPGKSMEILESNQSARYEPFLVGRNKWEVKVPCLRVFSWIWWWWWWWRRRRRRIWRWRWWWRRRWWWWWWWRWWWWEFLAVPVPIGKNNSQSKKGFNELQSHMTNMQWKTPFEKTWFFFHKTSLKVDGCGRLPQTNPWRFACPEFISKNPQPSGLHWTPKNVRYVQEMW